MPTKKKALVQPTPERPPQAKAVPSKVAPPKKPSHTKPKVLPPPPPQGPRQAQAGPTPNQAQAGEQPMFGGTDERLAAAIKELGINRAYTILGTDAKQFRVHFEGDYMPSVITFKDGKWRLVQE